MKTDRILIVMMLAFLAGCGARAWEPVELSEGDMCTFCKMAISEKRYASELLDSEGEAYKFDDIGCMQSYMAKHNIKPAAIFVIDFDTKQWLEAQKAFYVRSLQFQTPMGGQIAAYRTEQTATAAAKKFNGERIQLW